MSCSSVPTSENCCTKPRQRYFIGSFVLPSPPGRWGRGGAVIGVEDRNPGSQPHGTAVIHAFAAALQCHSVLEQAHLRCSLVALPNTSHRFALVQNPQQTINRICSSSQARVEYAAAKKEMCRHAASELLRTLLAKAWRPWLGRVHHCIDKSVSSRTVTHRVASLLMAVFGVALRS